MRTIDTVTMSNAASHYASEFLRPDVMHRAVEGKFVSGKSYVMQDFYNFTFKDEFEFMLEAIRGRMGSITLQEFNKMVDNHFGPRSQDEFEQLLADKLAIDPNGVHIVGKIGTTNVGNRHVGFRQKILVTKKGEIVVPKNVYWPMYAGEGEERIREAEADQASGEGGIVDALPLHAQPLALGALNTRISNEVAILMCDAAVDNLDEGTVGAVVEGRVGTQPADPDTVASGTLLFALNANTATTFGAASDAAPGATATANTIDDDTSANATGTLGYCRASSANSVDTPLDDHIDGEAGTSGADFNFNTLSIVSGATVSLTSWTITQPES